MPLKDDLTTEVQQIFRTRWTTRDAREVPAPEALRLGNDGARFEGAVLYADLARSTALVDNYGDEFAAEIYKAYLTCCARIIKNGGGVITAYDGDRIMAVFIGDDKETAAVIVALKINWAIKNILGPALASQYPTQSFVVTHSVGIDVSSLLAARIGVRNDNDIVWVGRAANHAAKLSDLRDGNYCTWISSSIFNRLSRQALIAANQANMWEKRLWTPMNNIEIYRSSYWWALT